MSESTDRLNAPVTEEIRKLFEEWKSSLPKCVGYEGNCEGDLGMGHVEHCPIYGQLDAAQAIDALLGKPAPKI